MLKTSLVHLHTVANDNPIIIYETERHLDDLELFIMHVARTLLSCAYLAIHVDGCDSNVLSIPLLGHREERSFLYRLAYGAYDQAVDVRETTVAPRGL